MASAYRRRPKKYCGRECYFKSKAADWVEIQCQHCGKKRSVRKIYTDRGQYQYCSDKCRRSARLQGVTKEERKRICVKCGNEFLVSVGEHLSGKIRKHCSKKCQHRREMVKCLKCGREFETKTYRRARFCSNACYKAFAGETGIEKRVRKFLEDRSLGFETQVQFGTFVVDFFLPEKKLAIEADGEYWHRPERYAERDAKKDRYLRSQGLNVLRLPERSIKDGSFKRELQLCLS